VNPRLKIATDGPEMRQQVFDLSHEMENPMTRSGKVFTNERQVSPMPKGERSLLQSLQ
jgi:hypothetical protein